MKLVLAAVMACTLLLAGCATGPDGAPSSSSGSTAGGTGGAAVYPNGSLSPITAGGTGSVRSVVMAAPPADMWDRIRRGFKMPDLDTDLVRDREQWYASRPDYIQRMVTRSNRYIFHIVEELERRNMPTELALLPYIESAFNPQAVSSARAAGMWQFMPATGNDYDLKQNIFRDERRDVVASTRAALDYLQRLYNMFGDWHLALASYNWGEGSVGRAMSRNKAAGLPTGYTDLRMPDETRYYVPKLQAVKNIVADPVKFGIDLPMIPNHPYFQTVRLTRDIDVELAAKLADVRVEDFRALNPAAHKPILLAAGGDTEILLPWDNAEVFQRNFEAHKQGQYASWTAWVVPSSISVAEAAERTGMSEADLRAINNIPPRMRIKAGSTLIVPRSGRVQEDVAAIVAETGTLSFEPEVITRRSVVRAGRNDNVASIARRFGVSAASVAQWNEVSAGHRFKRGADVVLYRQVRAASTARVGTGARGGKRVAATAPRGGAKAAAPRVAARKSGGKATRAAAAPAGKASSKQTVASSANASKKKR